MVTTLKLAQLSDKQFGEISDLVRGICGINLHDGKKELIKARLSKRLRHLGLDCFGEYIDYVKNETDGIELTHMLDALSTNLTSFFREPDHFEHLANSVIANIVAAANKNGRRLRIWSAGCSSGEEPYSLAITAREAISDINNWDAKILATDISTRVLQLAKTGLYGDSRVKTVAPQLRSRYFDCVETRPDRVYKVKSDLRNIIHFARLNLMDSWPIKGPFDAIFCRNVMIYFDKPTQDRLINRFWDLLGSGGTLFIGHSESLTGTTHKFRYVKPTVYQK